MYVGMEGKFLEEGFVTYISAHTKGPEAAGTKRNNDKPFIKNGATLRGLQLNSTRRSVGGFLFAVGMSFFGPAPRFHPSPPPHCRLVILICTIYI